MGRCVTQHRAEIPPAADLPQIQISRQDAKTLLVAARMGFAWSREEAQTMQEESPHATRVGYLRRRTEMIRSAVETLEELLDLPDAKRAFPRERYGQQTAAVVGGVNRGEKHWRSGARR